MVSGPSSLLVSGPRSYPGGTPVTGPAQNPVLGPAQGSPAWGIPTVLVGVSQPRQGVPPVKDRSTPVRQDKEDPLGQDREVPPPKDRTDGYPQKGQGLHPSPRTEERVFITQRAVCLLRFPLRKTFLFEIIFRAMCIRFHN